MKFALKCKPGQPLPKSGRRVAIVGAGPAGLAAAGELVCLGHEVHVYDQMPEPGGLLLFGIPEFRIPKRGVREGIEELRKLGVVFHQNVKVGEDVKLAELIENYDAVLIATGTWKSREMNVPGERELKGVFHALYYILDYNSAKLGYKSMDEVEKLSGKVAVIGGGLTAIDACLVALEMGAEEVTLIYRRTRKQAPAGEKEFNAIEAKGVKVRELTQPIRFVGDSSGRVKGIEAIKMKLGEPDKSGRPRPVPVEGSEHFIEADYVLIAAGLEPTPPRDCAEAGIELNRDGTIKVDEKFMTSRDKVFAAGDVKHGPWLIGPAMKSGREAARYIHEYLTSKS